MNAISTIALSGMRVALQGTQVAAHNIATMAVDPPAWRQELHAREVAGGGVAAVVSMAGGPGQDSFVRDLLTARLAVTTFTTNATLITRYDQMLGGLFDARA